MPLFTNSARNFRFPAVLLSNNPLLNVESFMPRPSVLTLSSAPNITVLEVSHPGILKSLLSLSSSMPALFFLPKFPLFAVVLYTMNDCTSTRPNAPFGQGVLWKENALKSKETNWICWHFAHFQRFRIFCRWRWLLGLILQVLKWCGGSNSHGYPQSPTSPFPLPPPLTKNQLVFIAYPYSGKKWYISYAMVLCYVFTPKNCYWSSRKWLSKWSSIKWLNQTKDVLSASLFALNFTPYEYLDLRIEKILFYT